LPTGAQNAARHRLQAKPMFVARKDLDRPAGMRCRFFGDSVFEGFLKIVASSAAADLGFFGRGVWRLL
jgi:hypothetical protein